jgi:hypothetical protein
LSLEDPVNDSLLVEPIDNSQVEEELRLREERLMNRIESDLNSLAQKISSEKMCCVCMCETSYHDLTSDTLRFTTRCGHVFCIKCIARWAFTNVKFNSYSQSVDCSCPICRTCFYTYQS